jgi:hypothetical protein
LLHSPPGSIRPQSIAAILIKLNEHFVPEPGFFQAKGLASGACTYLYTRWLLSHYPMPKRSLSYPILKPPLIKRQHSSSSALWRNHYAVVPSSLFEGHFPTAVQEVGKSEREIVVGC